MPYFSVIFMTACDFILGCFLLLFVDVGWFTGERFVMRWILDFLCAVHDFLRQNIVRRESASD